MTQVPRSIAIAIGLMFALQGALAQESSAEEVIRGASKYSSHPERVAENARTFQFYDNYDVSGQDIKTITGTIAEDCRASCLASAQCGAFSFNKWTKLCVLKGTIEELRFDPSMIAGLPSDKRLPPSSSASIVIKYYPQRQFSGEGTWSSAHSTANDCEQACKNDESCVGFTFLKREACKLFNSVDSYSSDDTASSGIKRQEESNESSGAEANESTQTRTNASFSVLPLNALFYARRPGVVVRREPSLMAAGALTLAENRPYSAVEKLTPKQSESDDTTWYQLDIGGGQFAYARAADIYDENGHKMKLIYDVAIPKLDSILEQAQRENSGRFARYWGVYSNNIATCQMGMAGLQWLVWFQGSRMRAVILNNPNKIFDDALRLYRSFKSTSGTIIWYSFSDLKLAFFKGQLLINPKFSGTRVRYTQKPKCHSAYLTIKSIQDSWRKIVHDLPTEKHSEQK